MSDNVIELRVARPTAQAQGDRSSQKWQSWVIFHPCDIGDLSITIEAPEGYDPRYAAIYLQFTAEKLIRVDALVSSLGIAAGLVAFYGCRHAARNDDSLKIDLHNDREALLGDPYHAMMADPVLYRGGLREFLIPHLDNEDADDAYGEHGGQ